MTDWAKVVNARPSWPLVAVLVVLGAIATVYMTRTYATRDYVDERVNGHEHTSIEVHDTTLEDIEHRLTEIRDDVKYLLRREP